MTSPSPRRVLSGRISNRRLAGVLAAFLLAAALFLPACGSDATPTPVPTAESPAAAVAAPSGGAPAGPADRSAQPASGSAVAAPVSVVTSNALLSNLAQRIGGDRVDIYNLVPPGSDVHSYQSTPQDSVRIAQASVIISNGASLSVTTDELIATTAPANAVQVVASHGLQPLEAPESITIDSDHADDDDHDDDHDSDDDDHADDDHDDDHDSDGDDHADDDHDDHDSDGDDHADDADDHDDHDHAAGDPHFWTNPQFTIHYVNEIAEGFAAADPANAAFYADNAAAYVAELEALDAYIADTLAAIPPERRVLVTFHDAFQYFGNHYGLEVMAFVGGHGGDVSPDDIVRVLELVSERGLPAVFSEPQFSADALEQVARDSGVQVGIMRSLPDDAHRDYISMMRANADVLSSLLR